MKIEIRPGHRKEQRLHRKQRETEVRQAELTQTIAGIMKGHMELLPLSFTELAERFDATMRDPAIIRQKPRLGTTISAFLHGDHESIERNDIYDAFDAAFDAHQIKNNQWRKFSDQPYIVHPMRVALLSIKLAQAMGVPVTSKLIGAALTHDVVEDSPKINGKGRLYKPENVESLLDSNTYFPRDTGRSISADAYALSHHDVKIDGKVDEKLYYEKIRYGSAEAIIRREIVKAADRIDNLLDPLYIPEGLENLTKARKIRKQRKKYIAETTNKEGVINQLFPEGTFLRNVINAAIDISQQTVDDPDFDPFFWKPAPMAPVLIFPAITIDATKIAA